MDTHDALKRALMSKAEACIDHVLKSRAEGKAGDVPKLEQQVQGERRDCGRRCLEAFLVEKANEQGSAARRVGRCGHRQRLVGKRSREMVTLLGPMVVYRAS